jgi:hypothetical protein
MCFHDDNIIAVSNSRVEIPVGTTSIGDDTTPEPRADRGTSNAYMKPVENTQYTSLLPPPLRFYTFEERGGGLFFTLHFALYTSNIGRQPKARMSFLGI